MFLHKHEKIPIKKILYICTVSLLSTLALLFFKGFYVLPHLWFLGSFIIALKYQLYYPLTSIFKLGSKKPQCKENMYEDNSHSQIGTPRTFLILVALLIFFCSSLVSGWMCFVSLCNFLCSTVIHSTIRTRLLIPLFSCLPLSSCFFSVGNHFLRLKGLELSSMKGLTHFLLQSQWSHINPQAAWHTESYGGWF